VAIPRIGEVLQSLNGDLLGHIWHDQSLRCVVELRPVRL
jgi:hypothetical protein